MYFTENSNALSSLYSSNGSIAVFPLVTMHCFSSMFDVLCSVYFTSQLPTYWSSSNLHLIRFNQRNIWNNEFIDRIIWNLCYTCETVWELNKNNGKPAGRQFVA